MKGQEVKVMIDTGHEVNPHFRNESLMNTKKKYDRGVKSIICTTRNIRKGAYNEFPPVTINGREKHIIGVEWGYQGRGNCPEGLVCQQGPGAFSVYACFFVRDGTTANPQYSFQCLGGEDFTPQTNDELPVGRGEAFVAVRTIHPSPWDPSQIYLGGYDANYMPSFNTAWIASINNQDISLAEEFTYDQGEFIRSHIS